MMSSTLHQLHSTAPAWECTRLTVPAARPSLAARASTRRLPPRARPRDERPRDSKACSAARGTSATLQSARRRLPGSAAVQPPPPAQDGVLPVHLPNSALSRCPGPLQPACPSAALRPRASAVSPEASASWRSRDHAASSTSSWARSSSRGLFRTSQSLRRLSRSHAGSGGVSRAPLGGTGDAPSSLASALPLPRGASQESMAAIASGGGGGGVAEAVVGC